MRPTGGAGDGTYVVMQRLVAWAGLQAVPHEIAIEEDGSGAERGLGQLQHHADLQDEIDAFAAQCALFFGRHAVDDGRRLDQLILGEDPLLLCFDDGGRRRAWPFAHRGRRSGCCRNHGSRWD